MQALKELIKELRQDKEDLKRDKEDLKQNIYVNDADEKRIFYTNEFKARFMQRALWQAGLTIRIR